MRNSLADSTQALFNRINKTRNTANEPIHRAAIDLAISKEILDTISKIHEIAKNEIKLAYKLYPAGTNELVFADKGISCSIRVNNGAERLDKNALPSAILKQNWKDASGASLTLPQILAMIELCVKQSDPTITVTTAYRDM